MPAKQRIQFVVKHRHLRAALFEQRVEITAAGAVVQFDGHLQLRLFEGGEINELVELLEILGLRIKCLALIRADDRAFEGPTLRLKPGNVRFDCLVTSGVAGAPLLVENFRP